MIDPTRCEKCAWRTATPTGLCEVCEHPAAYGLRENGHAGNCDCINCGGDRIPE